MAHFAELDSNNIVTRVVVVDNSDTSAHGVEIGAVGQTFCQQIFGGGRWVQTSYSGKFRNCFAGIGYSYDPIADEFVEPAIDNVGQ